MLNKLSMTLKN